MGKRNVNLYKIYHDICNRGKERGSKRKKGFELHHILPKSMNGTNDISNLCLLTPKEHYVVHHCLSRTGNKKMIFAFWRMVNSKGHNSHKITAKEYELLKLDFKHSEETKNKISQSCKGRISPMQGIIFTEEHKRKISKANSISLKGIIFTEEHKRKISKALKGRKHSEEAKLKMKKPRKPHSIETKLKISESMKIKYKYNSSLV